MKTMKKFFASLLVLCMVLTLPNMAAYADEPAGTQEDPKVLTLGEGTASLEKDNIAGCYYKYVGGKVEEGKGLITFVVDSSISSFVVTNTNTYATAGIQYGGTFGYSGGSFTTEDDKMIISVTYAENDPIEVWMCAEYEDPETHEWICPAATVTWTASVSCVGIETSPESIATLKGFMGWGTQGAATVKVGSENGWYYSYEVESDGTLQMYVDDWSCDPTVENGLVADIIITNKTTNQTVKYSTSTVTIDNYGTELKVVELKVSEGDELIIEVVANEAGEATTATVGWQAMFTGSEGSKASPVMLSEKLELDENDVFIIPTEEAPLKIVVPAGKIYYVQGPYNLSEMYATVVGANLKLAVMQADGSMADAEVVEENSASIMTEAVHTNQGNIMFTIENTGETDVEYGLYFDTVEGTYYAPAVLEDTDTHEFVAGDDVWYYTYVATEDGYIKVNVNSTTEWYFYVENVTTGEISERHYSNNPDAEVVADEYLEVSKDDEILIAVMSFDAEKGDTVAGKVITTVTYTTPDVATVEGTIGDIESANTGDTVIVEIKDKDGKDVTVIPEEVLAAAKDKDIVLGILGDFYAWALYGTDIKDVKDLDLAVTITTDVIAETLIKAIAGENEAYAFNIAHDGALGLTAELGLNVGVEYFEDDAYANLYYYNEAKELEFVKAVKVDEDGFAVFEFDHASDYVVVLGEDLTPEDPDDTTNPGGGTTTPGGDTTTPDDDKDTVDKLGDLANPMIYVIVLLGAALVGAGFVAKKRFA